MTEPEPDLAEQDVSVWLERWNASDVVRLGYVLPRHRHERQEKLIADLAVMFAVAADGGGRWVGFEAELLIAARELRRMRAEDGKLREFGSEAVDRGL